MTSDKKKLVFWAVAIGLVVYLTKCGGHPLFTMRRAQPQQNMKKNPFPGRGANGRSGDSTNPQFPPPPPRFVKLGGHWEGHSMINNRGVCTLKFEMRRAPESQFKGFSSLICTSMAFLTPGAKPVQPAMNPMLTQLNPSSAIMTGKVEGAAIRFTVDQTINNSPDGCIMKTFALTPFGQDQIATEWTEDKCAGGQMVLQRAQQ
jgi:hypothetical protein